MPVELDRALAEIVGPANVLTDPDVLAGYTVDWTGRWRGPAALVVRPASTAEVAAVVVACRTAGVAIIPQGGNTGLVGGGVPGKRGGAQPLPVILSLTRLTALDPVDEIAEQVTASAGVALARLQDAARAAGLSFPVDLAGRDSATVGGMIATNAGGIHVLRYGGMRQQVLGVEAVLADGRVISRLAGLVKDNTGYELSQLLIGSEGTLAVVTRARLRLAPMLSERVTALLGLADTAGALTVLAGLRRRLDNLEAAEVFYQQGLDLVIEHAGLNSPFPAGRQWGAYLLVECAGRTDPTDSLAAALDSLEGAGVPDDDATAVATDAAGRAALWAYRERHTEAVNALGVPHKLDVTLPLGRLAEFETAVRGVVPSIAPSASVVLWGHIGDGNLHVNVVGPAPEDEAVDDAVLRLAARLGGSISAEHGIGRAKVRWLGLTRTEAEIDAMAAVKRALDPLGTFNPGVLLPDRRGGR